MLKRRETWRKLKPGFKSKLPKEPIVVEDYQVKNPPPPLWMPEFGLYMTDRDILLTPDQWLTDAIVDAAQDLIKRINPAIGGLQRVCCGLIMAFMVEPDEFLQIAMVIIGYLLALLVQNIPQCWFTTVYITSSAHLLKGK